MAAPDSSYSALVIHMEAKVLRLERIDPPIQTLNLLSGGATTLIFMVLGANLTISELNLVSIP